MKVKMGLFIHCFLMWNAKKNGILRNESRMWLFEKANRIFLLVVAKKLVYEKSSLSDHVLVCVQVFAQNKLGLI